ncbi:hypothetical protein [Niallia sp. FSL R7-0271]|uniref:hypothetical protein n=1 Tax=Niallia sp. FSL R7-0271 TaxID=2921678 RepID=UPI0030F74196
MIQVNFCSKRNLIYLPLKKLVVYDVGDQYLSFVIDDAIYIEYLKENGIKKTALDMPYGAFCEGTIEFNQNLFTIINLIDYYQTISEGIFLIV